MFYGAEKGDLEIVKLLIEGGANLSLKDKVFSLCGPIMTQSHSQTFFQEWFQNWSQFGSHKRGLNLLKYNIKQL